MGNSIEEAEKIKKMENDIDLLIGYISPFGIWTAKSIFKKVENKLPYARVTEVIQHLVDNGFAIFRFDVPSDMGVCIELTDRGRELKGLGSIVDYHHYVEYNNHKKQLQDQRTNSLWWINFWIAVGAIVAGLYYGLEILNHWLHIYPICFH